ncbi:MAG: DUF4173 domain-containing protein [Bacteroidia bacterium]
MKNGIFILVASVCYTFLLYQQGIGVNVLLLNLVLLTSLFISNKHYLQNKLALLFAFGALFSSVFAFVNGHFLTVIANIISLTFLSISINLKQQSVLTSLFHVAFSYFTSLAEIVRRAKMKYFKESPANNVIRKKIIIYLSSIVVFALFITLYQASNVTFRYFIEQFNFKFLSFHLLFFYSISFVLMYAFFRPRILAVLSIYERTLPLNISKSNFESYTFLGNEIEEETEFKTGVVMLGLLNLLLLLVNILDLQFLFNATALPVNITYAEFVHQGIFSLILSIIIAIAIIIWYFRGTQNFAKQKTLKTLAYVWIAQNAIMLLSAAYKNNLYINEYSLTYKRIGVYVFLICTLAGLLFTAIKLINKQSNFYLLKNNSLVWYIILILSVPFSWDKTIAEFNIEQATFQHKKPDLDYLYSLSYQALPTILNYEFSKENQGNLEEFGKKFYENRNDVIKPSKLLLNLNSILLNEDHYTWQSYNFQRCNGYDELDKCLAKVPFLQNSTLSNQVKILATNRNLNW